MKKSEQVFFNLLSQQNSEYVTSGLVFQIDGLQDLGTLPTDLVGGIAFTTSQGTIQRNSQNDGWLFDGSTVVTSPSSFIQTAAGGTVEIVLRGVQYTTTTKPIFFQTSSYGIMAGLGPDNQLVISSSTSVTSWILDTSISNTTISATINNCYQNGQAKVAYGTNQYTATGLSIGGRYNSSNRMVGEICAIRVYNRQLTPEEMEYNQSLDIVRFRL